MSRCKVCSCDLGNVPMCFGSSSPASLMVAPEEYDKRVLENADQCIVDGEHYFVRGHIEIPVTDTNEVFIWSVWISLSEQSFYHMSEHWDSKGREKCDPYFGWLSTKLSCYPETLHLKTSVQSQPIGCVPTIEVELTEHPLSQEQENGITMERIHEIVHQVMEH
jgi:hypothetical protein